MRFFPFAPSSLAVTSKLIYPPAAIPNLSAISNVDNPVLSTDTVTIRAKHDDKTAEIATRSKYLAIQVLATAKRLQEKDLLLSAVGSETCFSSFLNYLGFAHRGKLLLKGIEGAQTTAVSRAFFV